MPRVIHFDLMSEQPETLVEFCTKAFDWKIVKWDGPMEYWLVGTGDRSERIRTYNFPQGRVTDHRVGLTLHSLNTILEGDIDPLIQALQQQAEAEKLKATLC